MCMQAWMDQANQHKPNCLSVLTDLPLVSIVPSHHVCVKGKLCISYLYKKHDDYLAHEYLCEHWEFCYLVD